MTNNSIKSLWSQNNFQNPASCHVGSTVSVKKSIMEHDQTLTHEMYNHFATATVSAKKYQLILKLLAGEHFLRWLRLPCTAGDAILVASKKTNVTVMEI